MTYRYSLEVQHDFGKNWVMTLGYQGSATHHYTVQTNLNWYYIPLNPGIQNLNLDYNGANANCNAALVGFKHRFSNTFEVDANYAWAKAMDEGSNDYFIGTYPFNVNYE